ncbi:MAG TPA: hypothetical protein VFS05_14415, partial [Gemmatimonadaceae bacterium]|nr:hypothetical protein [Gemmatimonadaceae bacterium]
MRRKSEPIELVQPPAHLPAPWHPWEPWPRRAAPPPAPTPEEIAMLAACELLARRGAGPSAWASPLRDHPIAFLLDAIGDAVNLWGADGGLIFRNPASEGLHLDAGLPPDAAHEMVHIHGRRFERRCQSLTHGGATYVIEVLHE